MNDKPKLTPWGMFERLERFMIACEIAESRQLRGERGVSWDDPDVQEYARYVQRQGFGHGYREKHLRDSCRNKTSALYSKLRELELVPPLDDPFERKPK